MFWNNRLNRQGTDSSVFDLPCRPRRLRKTAAIRDMVREHAVLPRHLIQPLFVEEGISSKQPVEALPGVYRYCEAELPQVAQEVWAAGIRAVLLFGVSHHKDAEGSDTWAEEGLMARMVRAVKQAVPDMVVITDNCFCSYTTHGHCGVVVGDHVDNDLTLQNLQKQAVIAAEAGADMVAPSAMMDGQVLAIREALDETGFTDVGIMSYSSKFASSFYGPFRAAADCGLKGDRKGYQLDPANGRAALMESLADEEEGADILMVKPGLPYLDVLADIRRHSELPLAVYQVSGEYAMLKAAAAAGAIDERQAVLEALTSFRRAGADLIITYYAQTVAPWLVEAAVAGESTHG